MKPANFLYHTVIFLAGMCLTGIASTQHPTPGQQQDVARAMTELTPGSEQAVAILAQLKQTRSNMADAYSSGDLDRLIAFYHADASHTVSSVTSTGIADIKERLGYLLKLDSHIHFRAQSIQTNGKDRIKEQGLYDYRSTVNGLDITSTYKIEWIHVDGRWLLFRYHADEPTWKFPSSNDLKDDEQQPRSPDA